MRMIPRCLSFLVPVCMLTGLLSCSDSPEATKPNIILIMTDDQGWGDLGFHGNEVLKTPALDSLASVSTRLTQFYVSPVCAPTRSSLLTGRYSLRTGVYDTYNGGAIMAAEEITIAEVLRENGYRTGIFGKWHLGDNYPFRPSDQGFERSLIHRSGGVGQVGDVDNYFRFDSSYFDPVLYNDNVPVKTSGYVSDVFTEGALKFLEEQKDRPFFLYLAYNAPHTPLQLPLEYAEMYNDSVTATKLRQQNPGISRSNYTAARRVYGMVSNIDDNLAMLFGKVSELGMRDNTMIIFLTDNGPQQERYNGILRGRKGGVYEGGTRVPFFISWPGHIAEDREIDQVAAHLDLFPTLLGYAGIEVPGVELDGIDLRPALEGKVDSIPRTLISYWQRGYESPYRNISVRSGDHKLVGHAPANADILELELYDIRADPGEENNMIGQRTELALELKNEFDAWYQEIVRSRNLVDFPRISIGPEAEDPVVLNRNDAKGSAGIWAENNKYLYWDVVIERSGLYNVEVVFRDTLNSAGDLTLRVGTVQRTVAGPGPDSDRIMIESLRLEKGKAKVDAWFREQPKWQNIRYPFYIVLSQAE